MPAFFEEVVFASISMQCILFEDYII